MKVATTAVPIGPQEQRLISSLTGLQVIFEGHTDSTALETYNQKLSERRADEVMQYVLQRGIPADRVSSIGYRQTMPMATNENKEGRALYRRVEIMPK